jgi:hypothetical protein
VLRTGSGRASSQGLAGTAGAHAAGVSAGAGTAAASSQQLEEASDVQPELPAISIPGQHGEPARADAAAPEKASANTPRRTQTLRRRTRVLMPKWIGPPRAAVKPALPAYRTGAPPS